VGIGIVGFGTVVDAEVIDAVGAAAVIHRQHEAIDRARRSRCGGLEDVHEDHRRG